MKGTEFKTGREPEKAPIDDAKFVYSVTENQYDELLAALQNKEIGKAQELTTAMVKAVTNDMVSVEPEMDKGNIYIKVIRAGTAEPSKILLHRRGE